MSYSALLLILLSAVSLLILAVVTLAQGKITYSKTLSWHIARNKNTIILGKILLPIAGMSLAVSTVLMNLAILPTVLLLVVASGFTLMGLIPYGLGPRRDRWHDSVAWISAFAGMAFAFLSAILGVSVWLAIASLAVQLLFAGIFWIARNYRPILAGQILYFVFFYLLLGSIALR